MRKILGPAVVVCGMLAAFGASAQDNQMYTTGSGDSMMVMGGSMNSAGAAVAGSKDACQEGGYYKSGDNMVTACGENGMTYELSAPESGAMMSNNQPYAEGSMMMKEHKM